MSTAIQMLGDEFQFERDGDDYCRWFHRRWSVVGGGVTSGIAYGELVRDMIAALHEYTSWPRERLTPEAVEFRDWLFDRLTSM